MHEDELIEPDAEAIEQTRARRLLIGDDGTVLGSVDGTPLGNVTVATGQKALGDRITIMAGISQLAGGMEDPAALRASIHRMIREAAPHAHFDLSVADYPNRTMGQTEFVVDCCREIGGNPAQGRPPTHARRPPAPPAAARVRPRTAVPGPRG